MSGDLPGAEAAARLKASLRAEGFVQVGIAPARQPQAVKDAFRAFLADGRQGSMDWLARDPERREDPRGLWPEAKSAILCAASYAPPYDPMARLDEKDRGAISAYAKRKDYHDVLKKRLKRAARQFAQDEGCQVKVFVDTAPILEKPLAEAAGLGWRGKHTNLVSRSHGSWLLLACILTDMQLPEDPPERDHCGSCRRCLDICPTNAFPAPYQLDARRCLAYLTIEHQGPIPLEFRQAMGNRIFGCDDCLAICPWNKFARESRDAALALKIDLDDPPLAELLTLDDAAFRTMFAGTPIKRTGRDRFLRNVCIAAGNSGDAGLLQSLERLRDDPAPLVAEAAVWATR